jgi:predicted nucleic acid-binding Zn ribbon protein
MRCLICGKDMTYAFRVDAKTCSPRCRKRLSRMAACHQVPIRLQKRLTQAIPKPPETP